MEPLEIRLTCCGQYATSQCHDVETDGFELKNILGERLGDSNGGDKCFQVDLMRSPVMSLVAKNVARDKAGDATLINFNYHPLIGKRWAVPGLVRGGGL